jgi:hypothetical protein
MLSKVWTLRGGASAAVVLLTVGAVLNPIGPRTASAAADMPLCTDAYFDRGIENYATKSGIVLPDQHNAGRTALVFRPGDKVTVFDVTGEVWAGVWFTPPNGPRGWEGWPAPRDWPAPGLNQFALVGRWVDTAWPFTATPFFIGTGERCYAAPARPSTLEIVVNDKSTTDNDGAFRFRLLVWKRLH